MTKRPQVGVGVLVTKDDQVLLMKRQNSHGAGTWSPPGGHLEYGEEVEKCAMREALEETGVQIADITFLAITNDVFVEEQEKHYITIWVEGSYVSGEPSVTSEREASEVGWFPWNALPEPRFLPFEHLLADRCYPKHALDFSRINSSQPDEPKASRKGGVSGCFSRIRDV